MHGPAERSAPPDVLLFSVDAALLAELGERLVGEPYIALGELIKNAYDADASRVIITFTGDTIVVEDDGHGMTFDEFARLWMRVGSTHKNDQRHSRERRRALTGSKGVGRLAVQFLARRLTLQTSAGGEEVEATVYWPDAARPGAELVKTPVEVTRDRPPREYIDSASGMRLVLSELNHRWTRDDFRRLAREIWTLQPPFRTGGVADDFEVTLRTNDPSIKAAFDAQLRAVLDIWTARLVGGIHHPDGGDRDMRVTLEFTDHERLRQTYEAPKHVAALDFEVRVFNLVNRQPMGVKVGDARDYLNRFGGVHVYDAGFRLPYYGPQTDWLGVEQDHSHRLSTSELLPDDLLVPGGLSFLPTNSRLFGVVNVDTGQERRVVDDPGERLTIAVTRDRLVANAAYRELAMTMRWALDFYAMEEARRRSRRESAEVRALPPRRVSIREVLEEHRHEIPQEVFEGISVELEETIESQDQEADRAARRAGLLGALATAGIAAVGFDHEISKQIAVLEELAEELAATDREVDRQEAAVGILEWVERARETRRIFSFVMDGDQDEPRSMLATELCDTVVAQMRPLVRAVEFEDALPDDLRLPRGRFAEWAAIIQNVVINAANASIEAEPPRIRFDGFTGSRSAIRVHDNGVGVDLASAEELYEPFVRRLTLPPDRRRAGLGGTGLGLTIVRMLATALDCQAHFISPPPGYSTTLEISWRTE